MLDHTGVDLEAQRLQNPGSKPLSDASEFCTQCDAGKAARHTSGRLDCPRYAPRKLTDLFSSEVDPGEARDFDPSDPRAAAAAFVASAYPWQVMVTVTNSPYGGESVTATAPGALESRPHFVSEGASDKRFVNGMNILNRMVFGRKYWRDPLAGFSYAATLEFQKSGNPHHHALLHTRWTELLNVLEVKTLRTLDGRPGRVVFPQVEECFRKAGAGPIVRAEVCLKPGQAAAYITKACRYLAKTDGLTYGGPWPGIAPVRGTPTTSPRLPQ